MRISVSVQIVECDMCAKCSVYVDGHMTARMQIFIYKWLPTWINAHQTLSGMQNAI